ncbi:MAG: ATP-binding cassette domain-containing protein [Pseudomonadota bacterium]|nr:ATP-binding cassette domain-containing protein [Pseudomonadota bacterium]
MLTVRSLRIRGHAPVSFQVAGGECLAIQGPSGSGKTLLLRAIADLDPADGEIALGGENSRSLTGSAWRRRVRYLAAEPAWWADSVAAHFAAPEKARKRAASLGLPSGIFDRPVARLSAGERQRLALLRALEGDPRVLLLDEPTAALDAASTRHVERLLKSLLKKGRILLLVSHAPRQAKRLARRKLVLGGAKIRERAS